MRPTTPEMERKQKIRALIIGLIIIAILAGYFIFSGLSSSRPQKGEKGEIYFSKADLDSGKISPEDKAILRLEVRNRVENYYENVRIQLSTKSPNLAISPTNPNVDKERDSQSVDENTDEYLLTIFTPLGLGEGEETRTYAFEIVGNPGQGAESMVVTLEARAMIENEVIDTHTFEITITSK